MRGTKQRMEHSVRKKEQTTGGHQPSRGIQADGDKRSSKTVTWATPIAAFLGYQSKGLINAGGDLICKSNRLQWSEVVASYGPDMEEGWTRVKQPKGKDKLHLLSRQDS